MENEESKKKKKKILFIGLGTITTGVLGFFGWQWWKDKKEAKAQSSEAANNAMMRSGASSSGASNPYAPAQDTASRSAYRAPSSSGNDGFPLKMGSRGSAVKALQQALISRYGASILPKYGADGSFGNEVMTALKKEGLPTTIDASTYASIVGNSSASSGSGAASSSGFDAVKIAADLHSAIDNASDDTDTNKPAYNSAIAALKRMNSVKDYTDVRTEFEKTTIGFVHETPVNALLTTFNGESQKVNIRLEFQRMGLLYNKDKDTWSLPSLSGLPYKLITKVDTQVMDKNGKETAVGKNTLLGNPVGIRGEWVYFFPFNAQVLLRVKKDEVSISTNH